jgi:hypothetical protein
MPNSSVKSRRHLSYHLLFELHPRIVRVIHPRSKVGKLIAAKKESWMIFYGRGETWKGHEARDKTAAMNVENLKGIIKF